MHEDAQASNQAYTARCYVSSLERNPEAAQPPLWRKAAELEGRRPIYILVSVDSAGIHFSCAPAEHIAGFAGFENNELRYRFLTRANSSEPVTVPLSYFDLYYVPYRRTGNLVSTITPARLPGYVGALSVVGDSAVKIAIIYTCLRDSDLDGCIIKKEPPLQLDLMVVDPTGQNDPAATRELYNALLEAQTSND